MAAATAGFMASVTRGLTAEDRDRPYYENATHQLQSMPKTQKQ